MLLLGEWFKRIHPSRPLLAYELCNPLICCLELMLMEMSEWHPKQLPSPSAFKVGMWHTQHFATLHYRLFVHGFTTIWIAEMSSDPWQNPLIPWHQEI